MNHRILLFGMLYFIIPSFASSQTTGIPFTFTIDSSAKTSAGLYKSDGTLVRTLWSIEPTTAGKHTAFWDGKDDKGNIFPGTSVIKVVSNNVSYNWKKPIGNTSANTSGPTVFHATQMITNMVPVGNAMYYAVGYNENGGPGDSHCKFKIGTPNISTTTLKNFGPCIRFLAYDGNKVFFVGQTLNYNHRNRYFVGAIKPAPSGLDTIVTDFSNGINITTVGVTYSGTDTLGYDNYLDPQNISGLAVQTSGNFLFTAHGYEGFIKVFNKNTLAFVNSIAVTNPRQMTCDSEGNLWMVSGTHTVAKYTVNSDGSLSLPLITLSDLTDPLDVAISPNGEKIAVMDRGIYHQVKFFNTTTGSLMNVLGRRETYLNPAVYDDKFYFNNTSIFSEGDWGRTHAFIQFEPNGSYWVGDYGNTRCQHFSSDDNYIDNIQYLGFSYSTQVDINNPSRVFSDYLEFNVDHKNNTWQFIRNWSHNITIPRIYSEDRMRSVTTLSNGRTYALEGTVSGGWEVIELDPENGIRFTGEILGKSYVQFDLNADGAIWQISETQVGKPAFWKRKPLIGFDNNNNPLWSDYETVETTPAIKPGDPVTEGGYIKRSQITSTGIVATFSKDKIGGWHAGLVKNGKWIAKFVPSTNSQYAGVFPKSAFEIGNGSINVGTFMQVVDRNIFFGQQCENWKQLQVNKHKHYLDNGLQIGEFGVSGDIVRATGIEAYPGYAGNANSGTYVKVGSDIYLNHCDEAQHGAVHEWHISGLESIKEYPPIPVTVPVPETGLRAYFYSTSDLNNLNTISTSVQTTFNLSGLSARWLGYVKPAYSENYTFYITTSGACRLWMGDSILLDAWTNGSNSMLTSRSIALDENTYHSLRIEGRASIILSWSSSSQPMQVIPLANLFAEAVTDFSKGYNLQDGLRFSSNVENGLYGYTRNPSNEILINKFGPGGWWSCLSGVQSYDKTLPDVQVDLSPFQDLTSAYLSRDLGSNSDLSSWAIKGLLTYPASDIQINGGESKSYLEVLDVNDKVLLRIERKQFVYKSDYRMYANGQLVFQVDGETFAKFDNLSQVAEINYNGTTLSFKYGPYFISDIKPTDGSGDLKSPKSMRIFISSTTASSTVGWSNMKFYRTSPGNNKFIRSGTSGNWNNISSWQASADSITWVDATAIPDTSAMAITIQTGHIITIVDSANVDQMNIQSNGVLKVAPNAVLVVKDGPGNDLTIASLGSLIIKSDSTGTGRIGQSTGNIIGNATVERYINAANIKSYRLLSPSVNTVNSLKPFIRDNWQEGQNNNNIKTINNLVPHFGIQITGSTSGANGFDATSKGAASLFTYNPSNAEPSWVQVANTNATTLEAKKGYLVIIFGDRSTDLRTSNASSSTTLRAIGTISMGTQIFTKPAGDRGNFLVGNPYPSPINWNTIYNDASTSNSKNLENYYTYWDSRVGTTGGYVTVNSNGIKSAPTNATTEIQSGQAFLIKPKKGIAAPVLTIKESHKSKSGNLNVFRLVPQAQIMTALYFSTNEGRKIMADAVNTVFDNAYSGAVDDNDAEEMANPDENVAIKRDGKMLSIEGRPILNSTDTLPLVIQRLKAQEYEWQFDPTAFTDTGVQAYLDDKFLNTQTPISMVAVTTVPFTVANNLASAAQDRFRIVFSSGQLLPAAVNLIKAHHKTTGNQINWTIERDKKISQFDIERSHDDRPFIKIGSVQVHAGSSMSQDYSMLDPDFEIGMNNYRVKLISKSGITKYSDVASVENNNTQLNSINVFPNPVTGNYATLQFKNLLKGIYSIKLFNNEGILILSKSINHPGGSGNQTIPISATLPAGVYNIQISGNGRSFYKKLIK